MHAPDTLTELFVPAPGMLTLAHTHLRFELGGHRFAATLFGSKHGLDWSVSQLDDPTRGVEYAHRLGGILCALNVGDAFVANATQFNARVGDPSKFSRKRQVGGHFLCLAAKPYEGTQLAGGNAGVQSPAGCLTMVVVRPGHLPVKAHAGRWSLINRYRQIQMGRPDNDPENVCSASLERLGVRSRKDASEVRVKILWGIAPHLFPHPLCGEHAATNRWLQSYAAARWGEECARERDGIMYLDIARIAQMEFLQWGVLQEHVDTSHAVLPQGAYTNGSVGKPRNLVVVKCLH